MSVRGLILDAGALIQVEGSPRGHVYGACREALDAGTPALLPNDLRKLADAAGTVVPLIVI